jgi:hypothetical protein
MGTCIEKGSDLATPVTADQQGNVDRVHSLEVTGAGKFAGERKHQRDSLEHALDFAVEPRGIRIARGRHLQHIFGKEGPLAYDIIEHSRGGVAYTSFPGHGHPLASAIFPAIRRGEIACQLRKVSGWL